MLLSCTGAGFDSGFVFLSEQEEKPLVLNVVRRTEQQLIHNQ
jgi:hypothetical protein